jgi:hypothetical protein
MVSSWCSRPRRLRASRVTRRWAVGRTASPFDNRCQDPGNEKDAAPPIFGFEKNEVVQTLSQLLSSAELSFESETALELALARHKTGPADYSDCVHVALAAQAGEQPLWTFDKAASKVEGARLLTA